MINEIKYFYKYIFLILQKNKLLTFFKFHIPILEKLIFFFLL
jgi:hypothetical protein